MFAWMRGINKDQFLLLFCIFKAVPIINGQSQSAVILTDIYDEALIDQFFTKTISLVK